MTTLPQISLAKLAADTTRHQERERLRLARGGCGFFYLERGIPKEQIAEAIQVSRRVLRVATDDKGTFRSLRPRRVPITTHGYSPLYSEVLHPEVVPEAVSNIERFHQRRHEIDIHWSKDQ